MICIICMFRIYRWNGEDFTVQYEMQNIKKFSSWEEVKQVGSHFNLLISVVFFICLHTKVLNLPGSFKFGNSLNYVYLGAGMYHFINCQQLIYHFINCQQLIDKSSHLLFWGNKKSWKMLSRTLLHLLQITKLTF